MYLLTFQKCFLPSFFIISDEEGKDNPKFKSTLPPGSPPSKILPNSFLSLLSLSLSPVSKFICEAKTQKERGVHL